MNRLKLLLAITVMGVALAPLQAQVGKSQGLFDANRATQQELMSLPHMSAEYVKAIMDKRPFANVTEFAAAFTPPLTRAQLSDLYARVFVHVNLNTATDDEILSIPAAQPNRVLREFKEYRPYKSMEQFRKEIGKYVDANEVARLERYVTIR